MHNIYQLHWNSTPGWDYWWRLHGGVWTTPEKWSKPRERDFSDVPADSRGCEDFQDPTQARGAAEDPHRTAHWILLCWRGTFIPSHAKSIIMISPSIRWESRCLGIAFLETRWTLRRGWRATGFHLRSTSARQPGMLSLSGELSSSSWGGRWDQISFGRCLHPVFIGGHEGQGSDEDLLAFGWK